MQRVLLVAALWHAFPTQASPPVTVRLRSSWPAPPLLLEILETVSTENETAFFPLLDRLTDPEYLPNPPPTTPEGIYHFALQTVLDSGLVLDFDSGVKEAVELGLALHASTPKLEAFYQYYLDHGLPEWTEECGSWVDWYGTRVCDAETLAHLAGHETIDADAEGNITIPDYTSPSLLTIDHVFPSPSTAHSRPPRTAILYASPESANFRSLHTYLLEGARAKFPRVEYVLRHAPSPARDTAEKTFLSGYGVVLDLKKMDYLAVDDRRASGGSGDLEDSEAASAAVADDIITPLIEAYPEPEEYDLSTALDKTEIYDLGAAATDLIVKSKNPFSTLKYLSQDFPKYAVPLARRVNVSDGLVEELLGNGMKTTPGGNAAWLNGATVTDDEMTPFGLLRIMRKERNLMKSLTSLGLTVSQGIQIISHPAITKAQSENDVLDGLMNASDRPEGGDLIIYWNDIEKDSRYASWQPSLMGFMRPVYPGQPMTVKRNVFNVVAAVDLSQTSSLYFITTPVQALIKRGYGIRFGVVPITETEDGARMARLFYYMILKYGRGATMGFLRNIAHLAAPPSEISAHVDWEYVAKQWEEFIRSRAQPNEDGVVPEVEVPELESILTIKNQVISKKIVKAQDWVERLQATLTESPTGHFFLNGRHYPLDDDFLRHLNMEMNLQTNYLQQEIYHGRITDAEEGEEEVDISNYFYDRPDTMQRRSRYTFPSTQNGGLQLFNIPDLFARTGFEVSEETFLSRSAVEHIPLTTYIVADFSSGAGIELVKEALKSFSRSPLTRFSFIHNPTELESWQNPPMVITAMVKGLYSIIKPEDLIQFLDRQNEAKPVIEEHLVEKYQQIQKSSRLLLKELEISPGETYLLMNGRLVGPVEDGTFTQADFVALESYELRKRTEPTIEALRDVLGFATLQRRNYFADIVSMVTSVSSAIQVPDPVEAGLQQNAPLRPRTLNYQVLDSSHTLFTYGDNATALFHFGILLDPLSDTAQKWSSSLEWLVSLPSVYVEVHLNPGRYGDIPLKRFYRSSLAPRLQFDTELGGEVLAQTLFHGLPSEPIYTLGMDVPQSWLVRPRESLYDLDNIQLNALSVTERRTGVEATFELDFLVIEGHARETITNQPPRGLQLQLTTSQSTVVDDTQVVASLGYFQFKAKPGVFQLEIREGRGQEIYVMESTGNEGWSSPTVTEAGGTEIMVASFDGVTIFPRFLRLPGMERADVLSDLSLPTGNTDSGVTQVLNEVKSKLSSAFGGLFSSTTEKEEATTDVINAQADINIFTVASGLLYERFVGIMILSVLRNTKSTVKFWFIENFLSPSFLEFIPHFAKAYNFQYELVTYKWPSWLRAQKEKQRIIWAYKILFLDVLFPMDLKKVIFVDADQIVRTDLQELVDLDLHGAPYGYTPMGDDNRDMEGFRFWKTGYWKEFLQGKPYHISALYVIDLVKFRKMAAGDILRREYHALSADPNSLANLDQDLPNNLQHMVPIFSLPEDWLWCETWCSKDRLGRAKTIDLCQNPLTKEPKLARARQIPEWEVYDGEIARFARQLAEEGILHSSLATAGVDALANAGAATPGPDVEAEGKSVDVEENVAPVESAVVDEGIPSSEPGVSEEHVHDEL